MLNTDINARQSSMMDFIDKRNEEAVKQAQADALNNNPVIKQRKLDDEYKKGKSMCIEAILAKVYKDALPFDDPKKNCSDDEARDSIHNFIDARTGGKGAEYYVREAIKRTNSSLLKNILTEAEKMAKEFYAEKTKDFGNINVKDLNFKITDKDEDVNKITKNLELDELSQIIQNNVQTAIQIEKQRAENEAKHNKEIEDALAADMSVVDDASMESAMAKLQPINQPKIYQPSLFEGIMLGKAKHVTESVGTDVFSEAVHEFTKLNIIKALKLERFDLNSVRSLANSYARA